MTGETFCYVGSCREMLSGSRLSSVSRLVILVRNITWHATVAQILGAMMAHELGHILLNLPSHSETGIMKGDWDLKELCDAAYGFLLFTRQQTEVIQADVARRNRQQTTAAEGANLAFTF
jgi:hypothetical protein